MPRSLRSGSSCIPLGCGFAALVILWFFGEPAYALSVGVQSLDCGACHTGGTTPTVHLTADKPQPNPGDLVTLTLEVSGGSVFGFYLFADEFAEVEPIGGNVLAVSDGATHSAPIPTSESVKLRWQTPDSPGGVRFSVLAVSANDNRNQFGDAMGSAELSLVWGCEPVQVHRDTDGDGYGVSIYGAKLGCAAANGWAAPDGDCDDANPDVHPNAAELCNEKDDDCDGEVDENTVPVEVYLDEDGDGFGVPDATELSCNPPAGFAANASDCLDRDPNVNPAAVEICNGIDDDCDGDIDEGVRPRCGVGWCRRSALGCDAASCAPGDPIPEFCNAFDDDCDGESDNGDLCASGESCVLGACVAATASTANAPNVPATGTTTVAPSTTASAPGSMTAATTGTSASPALSAAAPSQSANTSQRQAAGCSVRGSPTARLSGMVWWASFVGLGWWLLRRRKLDPFVPRLVPRRKT